jgi:hypothetical protein
MNFHLSKQNRVLCSSFDEEYNYGSPHFVGGTLYPGNVACFQGAS